MRVAADLDRDLAAQAAERGEVLALGGLGELPPDMQLGRALGRAAAALDDQGGRAEVADEVVELGAMSPASRSTTMVCICSTSAALA